MKKLILILVLSTSWVALAASGDLIYRTSDSTEITGAQAVILADAFISLGAWSGDRADMTMCQVRKSANPAGGFVFTAQCSGTKSAAPETFDFSNGATIIGVEP